MDKYRQSRWILKLSLLAIKQKLSFVAKGHCAISRSCQIPDLREIYAELGFLDKSGFFLEIGGFDGESYSNTSFLADQGWRGVYVEPIPDYCSRIRARHFLNNVHVEPVAVTTGPGDVEIAVMGELTSANRETVDAYLGIPWAASAARSAHNIRVPTVALDMLLRRHHIPNKLDLMVVDVEGGERPIIDSLIKSTCRPRVLIVELCDKHPSFKNSKELQREHADIRQHILSEDYNEYYVDEINSIFRIS